MGERSWKLPSGQGTITTNIDGFAPMGAEAMAASMVAAGIMTQAEADAALERRRKRREIEQAARELGATDHAR